MPKFRISETVVRPITYEAEIEAETPEEAHEIFRNRVKENMSFGDVLGEPTLEIVKL